MLSDYCCGNDLRQDQTKQFLQKTSAQADGPQNHHWYFRPSHFGCSAIQQEVTETFFLVPKSLDELDSPEKSREFKGGGRREKSKCSGGDTQMAPGCPSRAYSTRMVHRCLLAYLNNQVGS